MDSNPSIQLAAALVCISKGWYVFPLGVRSKLPDSEFAPNGFKSATNDVNVVREWWARKPEANVGIDLGRSNLTVLDFDKGKPFSELNLPETLWVNTSRGMHVYFQGVSKQHNMYFNGEHCGEIKSEGGYVLAPFSLHPDGPVYSVAVRAPIAPLPEGLLDRLKPPPTEPGKEATSRDSAGKVPHGQIHNWMLMQAGKLRNQGLSAEAIEVALLDLVHAQCAPPIDDSKVKAMARSICNFPAGQNTDLLLTQSSQPTAVTAELILPKLDTGSSGTRPVFPNWVFSGTSIGEGLVKPALEASSKHAEFIYIPAIQMMMNYLSGRVQVGFHSNLNLFVGLISPYGQFFKSSSCTLAMDYFKYMGLVTPYTRDLKSADNKTVTMQAGSPEGFGLVMSGINGSHAVLFNDELGGLVAKAGIDSSSFSSDLLKWYGSADFGNNTKNNRTNFNFPANSYTFSWLWATTDRGFNRHWPKLAGISSGLEDRMFFVVSPAQPKPTAPYHDPLFQEGALKTRQLIDKAILQKDFEFEDFKSYADKVAGIDPRSMDLVQKLALYFAVDMGATVIDGEHVERAVALVAYRNQAAKFLSPIEADNQQGRLQKEIIRELQQNNGKMKYRDLCRALDYLRNGIDIWNRAYKGMLSTNMDDGLICEFMEQQASGQTAKMVGLLKQEE
jgi:hypothetical protein